MRSPATLAVLFDFDDTLVPDSTSKLLAVHGIDPQRFWREDARALVERGYDPALGYLKLLLDRVGEGKPLGHLTNKSLREFGATLEGDLYQGLPALFDELRNVVAEVSKYLEIEFYIISGGLREVIEGCPSVRKEFTGVYGCELEEDPETGDVRHIKRSISFTEKTRYLFEIHKGISPEESRTNPQLVNRAVSLEKRRIPIKNMIYVGDGLTDIPCFSVVQKGGGRAFGVFDPTQKGKAKIAFQEFLSTDRVTSAHAPRYRAEDELGSMLRTAVALRCAEIKLEIEQAMRV